VKRLISREEEKEEKRKRFKGKRGK